MVGGASKRRMQLLAAVGALLLISQVLWDAFETIVLPRRVSRRIRLARLFYRATWIPLRSVARLIPVGPRENLLATYGSLALLVLLIFWAAGLVVGFGLLYWAIYPPGALGFADALYLSGSILFSLESGETPLSTLVIRDVAVVEAAIGLGFLALVIAYLPVMYDAFSRRELNTSLLDARAGSPPTAAELLRRQSLAQGADSTIQLLQDWEHWCAELLESHISYPAVAFFRSQHDNQSWLAALTMVLDVSALVMVGVEGIPRGQAQVTFAMARHAAVDLAQIFRTPPREPEPDRLASPELLRLRRILAAAGVRLSEGDSVERELAELRQSYEPYLYGLSRFFLMPLPPWIPPAEILDAWQTSAWDHTGDETGGPGTPVSPPPPEKLGR